MKKLLISTFVLALAGTANAQLLSENFDGNIGGTGGAACVFSSPGWVRDNNSSPAGTLDPWFIPSTTAPFPGQAGGTQSYCAANFNAVAGANTISGWLLTPEVPLANGNTLSFWTRTVTSPAFPDRLQVRMSTNGASVNTGTLATDVGDFTNLLLDINPTLTTTGYPNAWTQFNVNIAGLGAPTTGRLAFRYFVTSGGPSGANSDYIGIDTISYVPEPTTMGLLAVGALGLLRRRK